MLYTGHFDALRWEDQERIREQINGGRSGSSKAAAASKSSTKTETSEDYGVEYAKSSRSSCKACGDKIDKVDKAELVRCIDLYHGVVILILLRSYSQGWDLSDFYLNSDFCKSASSAENTVP